MSREMDMQFRLDRAEVFPYVKWRIATQPVPPYKSPASYEAQGAGRSTAS
jgi:hypothetical protein